MYFVSWWETISMRRLLYAYFYALAAFLQNCESCEIVFASKHSKAEMDVAPDVSIDWQVLLTSAEK
jgi:hypothetical protein